MTGLATVEFAGLPGSGKSHWASFTAAELRAAGRPVNMPRDGLSAPLPIRAVGKARSALSAISDGPQAAIDAVRPIVRSQQSSLEGLRRGLQWFDTQARLASTVPADGLLIMDEGPLQALWSVGLDGDWGEALEALDRHGYLRADLAVVLDVSPSTALARLERRAEPHRRLDRIPDTEEKLALLERGSLLLGRLVSEWVNRHGPETVLRLDSERPARAAEQIRGLLANSAKA